MKNSPSLIGRGLLASAMIVIVAALGFSVLDFVILLTTKDLAGPSGWLHEIGMLTSALFELDPDDDELILSSILVSLPVALMMAVTLWISHTRVGLPRSAGEIAAGGMTVPSGRVASPELASAPVIANLRNPAPAFTPVAANDCEPAPSAPCRACGTALEHVFLDLGTQPLTEGFLPATAAGREPAWPLRLAKCPCCHIVQTFETYAPHTNGGHSLPPELLMAAFNVEVLSSALGLSRASQIVEVASGDGTLLQQFLANGIAAVGIEADRVAADVALARGVPTRVCHFSVFSARSLVKDGQAADLLIARDLISRTVDPTRFADASRTALKPDGILLFEFPHLLEMIEQTGFEAICHERPSYFSLIAIERLFAVRGLRILHAAPALRAGWLRVFACRSESTLAPSSEIAPMLRREVAAGLDRIETFAQFAERSQSILTRIGAFFDQLKTQGKTAVAFGASPKGNALLSYCGVRRDTLAYVVDLDPEKHGLSIPGAGIPIVAPERIRETHPDFVMVLPGWSVEEVVREHRYIRSWGGQFGCLNVT